MKKHSAVELNLKKQLHDLGIMLNLNTGHLSYGMDFKPLKLSFELIFVRHGETFGNCGQSTQECQIDQNLVNSNIKDPDKRIFQGNVDEKINQLTEYGKQQAIAAAIKIENTFLSKGWQPDKIFCSPLTRAKETGIPFVERNNLWHQYQVHEQIKEMSFGCWENRRLCDFAFEDSCHQFYREQNALIKKSGLNANGIYQTGENFCEVILRAYNTLIKFNSLYFDKKLILFSHSMFGAACCILLGKGQNCEQGNYLAFDGKRQDGTFYTLPHATPYLFKT